MVGTGTRGAARARWSEPESRILKPPLQMCQASARHDVLSGAPPVGHNCGSDGTPNCLCTDEYTFHLRSREDRKRRGLRLVGTSAKERRSEDHYRHAHALPRLGPTKNLPGVASPSQTSFWPNFILVCADEVIESKFAHELAAVAHGRYWHTPTVLIWRKFFRPQSEWSRSRPVAAQCVDFVGVQRRGPGIKENLAGGCCQRRGWRTTQTRLKRTSPSLGIRRERILQSRLLSWCRHLKTTRTQLPTCFPISISWSCGARSVRLLRGRMAQTCRQSSYQ